MADDIRGAEADGTDVGRSLKYLQSIAQAGNGAAGKVNLAQIAVDDHTGIFAQTGQKHFHLHRGGVLRFVQNNKSV